MTPERALGGARLALRALREEDVATLAPWYGNAGALSRSLDETRSEPHAEALAITRPGGGGAIGVLAYREDDSGDGWLTFEIVAVEPGLRGLGLDAEAVRLIEEDAVRRVLARRFRAGVHCDDGLGLYFWLRLGYRPARDGEDSESGRQAAEIMAMVRPATPRGGRGGS